MDMHEVTVETLCRAWLDAKRDEDEAADLRKSLAAEIVARIPGDAESTDRREVNGLKLVITRKLTRTVGKSLSEDWAQLPLTVQQAFRWKPEIELKNLRALEFAAPDDYRIAATYITTKPATPSVSIEGGV